MKASELRKGVYYNDTRINKTFRVESFHDDAINHGDQDYSCTLIKDAEGVPLTEEWLIRFGFENSYRIDVGVYTPVWRRISFSLTIWKDGRLFYDWIGGNIEIKYVHQLQNLYYALTDTELEIKH